LKVRTALLAMVLAGAAPGALQAAEPPPAKSPPAKPPAAAAKTVAPAAAVSDTEVDMEFLEFLGSLDVEDKDWREYLEERPINKPAGKPAGQQVKSK
jgi:hypothetical protein